MKDYFFDMWTIFKAKLAGASKSKTVWFNLFGLFVDFVLQSADTLLALYGLMPDTAFSFLLLVMVAGNMFLRFVTKEDLAKK